MTNPQEAVAGSPGARRGHERARRSGALKAEEQMDDYLAEGLDKLKATYPDIWSKLDLAADQLKTATGSEDYQAVGLLCRDAMILFANAIFSPDFVPEGQELPPEGDAKTRMKMTLQHFGQLAGSEKLRNLTKAVWDYAVRLQHNQGATAGEARRTALFTSLALVELAAVVETATRNLEWVQKYGVYKCPACGSTELQEDCLGDSDGAWEYLACTKCIWSSEFL